MERASKKQQIETVSIEASVANRFRIYCQTISKSESIGLLMMINFFEKNGISPNESLEPRITILENLINKRINGLIALIRNIEKTQTRPSREMLQLLFQESPSKNRELVLEKKQTAKEPKTQNETDIEKYRNQALLAKEKLEIKNRDLNLLLQKVVIIRNSFGQVHLRLNMSKAEFEKLK